MTANSCVLTRCAVGRLHRRQQQLPCGQRAFRVWGKRMPALRHRDRLAWRLHELPALHSRDGVADRVRNLHLPVPRQHLSTGRCRVSAVPSWLGVVPRIHRPQPVHPQCLFGVPHPSLWPDWV